MDFIPKCSMMPKMHQVMKVMMMVSANDTKTTIQNQIAID